MSPVFSNCRVSVFVSTSSSFSSLPSVTVVVMKYLVISMKPLAPSFTGAICGEIEEKGDVVFVTGDAGVLA